MKRISYFDIVRGIGICLSVLGHCCITELRSESVITQSLYDGIYFFHMSLFFFLAGTLYGKKGITKMSGAEKLQYIRKKFCSLGIPYLFYSFGGYAIYVVLKKKTLSASLIEIFTTENHIFHHIWFLYVMFFVSIIVIFLNRKMRLAATVISGGAFIVISFLPGTTLISLYLAKYLFFYLMGILYWEKDQIFVQNRFRTILRILLFAGMDILYVAKYAGVPDLSGFPLIINRVICCSFPA
ncbi:MAG: acyltransferase family protein, partial [Blautia sp.]|nr:acyltransferase family protein [Blautia sp.]